jgi:hypothetical protein
MANKKFYPSLSEDGWVNNSVKLADKLLSDFFISDFSQTYLYSGAVSSFPWIIQNKQGNIVETAALVQSTLNVYFSRYFNNVVVESQDQTSADSPSKGNITLYIKFTDDEGIEYVIGKLLEIADMNITKIINLNNNGKI